MDFQQPKCIFFIFVPVKSSNIMKKNDDTYRAAVLTFILLGLLYLFDRTIGFSSAGLPCVMNTDNLILYSAVIFLIFKREKTIGLILLAIWLILNI